MSEGPIRATEGVLTFFTDLREVAVSELFAVRDEARVRDAPPVALLVPRLAEDN